MYFLLAISLIFALLLMINIFSTVAAEIFWRVVSPFLKNSPAEKRKQIIFNLSILPFFSALILIFVFWLPAFLLFESREDSEAVSFKLALISLMSLTGFALAFYRVFGTWWTTRRLVSNWLKNSKPIEIENVSIPVYGINHQFPVIAVVGIFRPRMFIARQVFDLLSSEELEAAIAHERGHLAGHDNFKRTVLRIFHDLLFFPLGKSLERAWTKTAEMAADEYAARIGGSSMALNLASALIKIARAMPKGAKSAVPAGSFLITESSDGLSERVRNLLELSETHLKITDKRQAGGANIPSRFLLGSLIASLLLLGSSRKVLQQVHNVTENIVAVLQ